MTDWFSGQTPGGPWSVSGLVAAIGAVLEQGFAACTVNGEIAGYSRAPSGHCYLNLKDPKTGAVLRCAMFRRAASLLDFQPADGQAVEVRGRLAVYEPRGELQFVVEAMRRSGIGVLYERFMRLRIRLESEGLFDAGRKRRLPAHPRAVGVVTSLTGAVLHDVATTLARRSPQVGVVIYPSLVQGVEAAAALCEAIAQASRRDEVDVLIVCRGGGSLEDLWAFNDERVVRAIAAASMPVVSGVGHETDVTLADLAADLRAATPTAAAERVAPANANLRQALDGLQVALSRRTRATIETQMQRIDRGAIRLARPRESVRRLAQELEGTAARLDAAHRHGTTGRRARLEALALRLQQAARLVQTRAGGRIANAQLHLAALDPRRVLARGYTLLTDAAGRPIVSIDGVQVGMALQAQLVDGQATLLAASVAPAPLG